MIKEAIATGENVEAAFASACRQLGVETIDASCDVLELPQKKTLGAAGQFLQILPSGLWPGKAGVLRRR